MCSRNYEIVSKYTKIQLTNSIDYNANRFQNVKNQGTITISSNTEAPATHVLGTLREYKLKS